MLGGFERTGENERVTDKESNGGKAVCEREGKQYETPCQPSSIFP